MSLKEKAAYLKGLAEGLGIDSESKEGKLISVIIETIAEMAEEIEELNENALDIGEELDAISSDLRDIEEFFFDDDIDDYDDFMGFDDEDDYDDFDDHEDDSCDDECDCEFCGSGEFSYETACPFCGVEITINKSDLVRESVKCSACGEEIEFDFEDEDDEESAKKE